MTKIPGYINLPSLLVPTKLRDDKERTGKSWRQVVEIGVKALLKMKELSQKSEGNTPTGAARPGKAS